MTIRIVADGCRISQAEQDRAERVAQRWPRFDPATMGARVVFRMEGRLHAAEAVVSRSRRDTVAASGAGDSFREALDELDGHVRRILRRDRSKRKAVRW